MTIFYGYDTIAGVGKEATYGTEVAATSKLRLVTADWSRVNAMIPNDALLGAAARGKPDQGLFQIEGTMTLDWTIDTLDILLEQFFGTNAGVASQGTLTLDTNPTDGDTMTVDAKVYTFQTTLTNVDGNIFIGASAAATQANIVNAFALTGTAGTDYATAMTKHPTVTIAAFAANNAVLTAKYAGTAGDSIATTETFTAGTNVFDAATLGTTTAGVASSFVLDDEIDDEGVSLTLGKGAPKRFTYVGAKMSQLVISGTPGSPVQLAWTGMATSEVLDSATNSQAVLNALSEPDTRILFHHLSGGFLIANHTDALAAGDNVKIDSFTITINRNLTQFHTQSQAPEQSRPSDFLSVSLEFNVPLFESTDIFLAAHNAHTPLQFEATFTSGSRTKVLQMPMVFVENVVVPISGAGLQPYTVTCGAYHDLANENVHITTTAPVILNET